MKLAPLKFKNYVWPSNPTTYSLTIEKNTAIHSYPYTNISEVDDLGLKPREVSGEGEFIGSDAYKEFKKLEKVFLSKGHGSLVHPIWKIQEAVFNRLGLIQEPTPNYVKYSFNFIEDTRNIIKVSGKTEIKPKTNTKTTQKVHVVKRGDTMWAIARKNKTSLNSLIKKNPQIKNPNLIYPGNKINL